MLKTTIKKATMTQSAFLKAVKGLFNTIREVDGYWIGRVGWLHNGWIVLRTHETFEDIKERTHTPAICAHTAIDLYKKLYNK